jgi:hypothetical protein
MSNRFTVLAGFLLLSVTSGSALAGASASCSATCPKGSCSIEIKEVEEPPVEGKSANPLGQDVIVRYVYNDPLDFARIELANQEALAVATLAIRKEIQRVIPSTAKHLDTLAAALEKGSIDGMRRARNAILRSYEDANLTAPDSIRTVHRARTGLEKLSVDCYCDSGGYPVCERV